MSHTETAHLLTAIQKAQADGYTHFAESLRQLYRRSLATPVILPNNSTDRTRCESPRRNHYIAQFHDAAYCSACGALKAFPFCAHFDGIREIA